ncbi:MAG: ATP-binding cassette domain-containing protein [Planctomycetota bacterium]|jgi:D-methionine transport system ATP-binding protein|nr:ATP-binding cassette domain-containing protein [Planctomycetota bacterium]
MTNTAAFIEINDLRKTYPNGVEALRGVSLSVKAGEIFGVIGSSGAGKSTLIRCLNRLEEPTAGQIQVDGRDIISLNREELRQARMDMGMIFQHFNLLTSRTVAGNVSLPLELAGRRRGETRERVAELLELVGLSDRASAYPAQLSGGQKQRVGIARALANNPRVLLCDEATSALDPQNTRIILSLIRDIQERLRLTVVLISHEMRVVTEVCDRVAVMEAGEVVETGPLVATFTRPRHPLTRHFVETALNRDDSSGRVNYQPQGILLRIFFVGPEAEESLLTRVIKDYGVEVNIRQGHIEHVKNMAFGTLLLDIYGERKACRAAIAYLRSRGQILEELESTATTDSGKEGQL